MVIAFSNQSFLGVFMVSVTRKCSARSSVLILRKFGMVENSMMASTLGYPISTSVSQLRQNLDLSIELHLNKELSGGVSS